MLSQFVIILPEIMLATLALSVQVFGVFYKNSGNKIILGSILLALGIIVYLLWLSPTNALGFASSFAISYSIFFFKAVVLGLALMSLMLYHDLMKITKSEFKVEFITLVLLSTLGIFISISARDFILLFCGLELSALSGYALAAFNARQVKSSEAGLKYFVLGALMSALMLFGISFLYGFSGSIKFVEISSVLTSHANMGLVVGAVLMLSAIFFKLSIVPFHIWTPDVYEGAPISSVSYFAVAQKFGMLVVLVNVVDEVVGGHAQISLDIVKIVAILSMFVGAFGGIMQSSLKRLMAYSSILNVGYVLVGVCLHSYDGNYAAYMYMLIYVFGVIGFFAGLVSLFGSKVDDVTFEDLRGIPAGKKATVGAIAIIMFSMIGLPPFAGFFGKYYVFYQAILQGELVLAIIGIVTSVVAAFYYLKVIKYMYFMDADTDIAAIPTSRGLWLIMVASVAFILGFAIFSPIYIL